MNEIVKKELRKFYDTRDPLGAMNHLREIAERPELKEEFREHFDNDIFGEKLNFQFAHDYVLTHFQEIFSQKES